MLPQAQLRVSPGARRSPSSTASQLLPLRTRGHQCYDRATMLSGMKEKAANAAGAAADATKKGVEAAAATKHGQKAIAVAGAAKDKTTAAVSAAAETEHGRAAIAKVRKRIRTKSLDRVNVVRVRCGAQAVLPLAVPVRRRRCDRFAGGWNQRESMAVTRVGWCTQP